MLDSHIIDLSFNKIFLKLALGEEVPLTIESLKDHNTNILFQHIDPELATSLSKIQGVAFQNEKLRRKLTPTLKQVGTSTMKADASDCRYGPEESDNHTAEQAVLGCSNT
ncbi:hypothetical protein V8D89_002381 [Ganoderma adspersum]